MVRPPSFLPGAVANQVSTLRARGFATRLQGRGSAVRLYRGLPLVAVTTEPVPVVIEIANRQSRTETSGPLELSLSGGTISAWAPWDVQRGDQFRYGTATAVIRDVLPASDGVQAATFEVMDGGGAGGNQ